MSISAFCLTRIGFAVLAKLEFVIFFFCDALATSVGLIQKSLAVCLFAQIFGPVHRAVKVLSAFVRILGAAGT